MDHRTDFCLFKHALDQAAVTHVAFNEGHRAPGELLDALQRQRRRIRQVVEHDDVVACLQQYKRGMRADITRAARE